MNRFVPIWVLLLCFLCWSLFTVAFGWAVKSTLSGSTTSGLVGRIAVDISSFPTLVSAVLEELNDLFSLDNQDSQLRVERDELVDFSGLKPFPEAPGIDVQGLMMRATPEKMVEGWRYLAGAFVIDGNLANGVLLVSPDLKIVKSWALDEVPVDGEIPRSPHRKFIHGVEFLKDGSIIFTFDGSVSLQRVDACGKRLWATGGTFTHAVALDDSGKTVWTILGDDLAQVSVADGAIVRRIDIDDVIRTNEETAILELRREHSNDINRNSRKTAGVWFPERFHFNDVEPLPAALADRFDNFKTGDLLVSARSLDLIFVLDPETLRIKWWRVGATQRQHDPDWGGNGKITVLNNRMSRDFSEIVSIDPKTFERTVLFDGRKNAFYTRIRGKHQALADGRLVVTSPQQGRAFEVSRDGDVAFEVVNEKPESSTTNYVLSELRWLPKDYLSEESLKCVLAQ